MKPIHECSVTIIGTGLMGASLAIALHGKVRRLYGLDANPAHLLTAKHHFDGTTSDLNAVRDSDLIILAVPVRAILALLGTLADKAKPGALILDLGSVKTPIVQAMDALPEHLLAVGGHPMCGKESSGPSGADSNMYKKARFVLCNTLRSTPDALDFTVQLVTMIGARPVLMDAQQHDQAVALISHLPYLVSSGLIGAVQSATVTESTAATEDTNANQDYGSGAWLLAASGFRDTSRLAGSDVTMMGDTVMNNREAVLAALDRFQVEIGQMRDQLAAGDDVHLRARLDAIRGARNAWYRKFSES